MTEKGGDYVIACKENQPTLHQEIREDFLYANESPKEDLQNIRHVWKKKSHGRLESRTDDLIEDCEMLHRFHDFAGASSIGPVRSRVDERYFITSLSGVDAVERFAHDCPRAKSFT